MKDSSILIKGVKSNLFKGFEQEGIFKESQRRRRACY